MTKRQATSSNPRAAIPWFEEFVATAGQEDESRIRRHRNAIAQLAKLGWSIQRTSVSSENTHGEF